MTWPKLHNPDELESLVLDVGLLPFFHSGIPGFSVEALTPSRYWFVAGVDGPWEWRMEVARRGNVAYGKLFRSKAGLVSREWYPDLANYRRDGYDFDARYDEGQAGHKEKVIVDLLTQNGPMLSRDLKRAAADILGKDGVKNFDAVMTRLQMQTYVTIHSFDYLHDKRGNPFGWGVARYALTEDVLGEEVTRGAYRREPAESKARLLNHLGILCPNAFDDELEKLLR